MGPVWIQFPRLSQYLVTFSANSSKNKRLFICFNVPQREKVTFLHIIKHHFTHALGQTENGFPFFPSTTVSSRLPGVVRQLVSRTPPPHQQQLSGTHQGVPLVPGSSGGSEKQTLFPFISSLPIHLFYFLPYV